MPSNHRYLQNMWKQESSHTGLQSQQPGTVPLHKLQQLGHASWDHNCPIFKHTMRDSNKKKSRNKHVLLPIKQRPPILGSCFTHEWGTPQSSAPHPHAFIQQILLLFNATSALIPTPTSNLINPGWPEEVVELWRTPSAAEPNHTVHQTKMLNQ